MSVLRESCIENFPGFLLLQDAGFQFAFDSIRCKFKPTEATLQVCEESGTDLAQKIKQINKRKVPVFFISRLSEKIFTIMVIYYQQYIFKIQERVAATKLSVAEAAPPAALALGRVVGSLCVLTARDNDAQSAMLASWVSQASFDPPGLTVAVKRDRAVEGLLPIGNKFVMNVLAEGKDRPVIKQLLKSFKPGEDRFEGMDVEVSESTGAVIIPQSAAYLECTVSQRMEAGDHYILYATVENGKVLDEAAESSVHFRKVGTTY